MKVKCILAVTLTLLLASCGPSAEDKAKIRQVISAYKRASTATAEFSSYGSEGASMLDLQRAVDAVPDGEARDTVLNCQHLLVIYALKTRGQSLQVAINLSKIGHGRNSTAKDFETANTKAQKDDPLPDYDPIAKCAVVSLPALVQ